jgi:hypothetical protein
MASFAAQYEVLSDDDILRIAADRKDLLDDARQALDQELLRRGLKEPDVRQYRSYVERAEIREATSNLRLWHGIGKLFFGKGAYVSHPSAKWEEFDTTLWVVIFLIPIFPVGTFRIRRSMELRPFGPWQSYKFRVISRRGRDWRLIFLTWGRFCLTIIILRVVLKLAGRF